MGTEYPIFFIIFKIKFKSFLDLPIAKCQKIPPCFRINVHTLQEVRFRFNPFRAFEIAAEGALIFHRAGANGTPFNFNVGDNGMAQGPSETKLLQDEFAEGKVVHEFEVGVR